MYCIATGLEVDLNRFYQIGMGVRKNAISDDLSQRSNIVALFCVYFTLVRDCTTKNAEKVSASEYWRTKNCLSLPFPLLRCHTAIFL